MSQHLFYYQNNAKAAYYTGIRAISLMSYICVFDENHVRFIFNRNSAVTDQEIGEDQAGYKQEISRRDEIEGKLQYWLKG